MFWAKHDHISNFFLRQCRPGKCLFTIFYNEKTPFQAIKTRSSKSQKLDGFPKGFTNGIVQNMAIFPTFFLGNVGEKMSFTIFQKAKTPFQARTTGSSKRQKIDIFPKGLTYGFGPKIAIFPTFFFRQFWPGKCLLRYPRTKKRFSRL